MRIDWKDPMIVSIVGGIICLVIAFSVLTTAKPRTVMKVKDNHEHSINWFKLVMLSIIMGLVVAIVTFLIMVRNQPTFVDPTAVKMQFSNSY